ncbi:MFS transporter [Parafrankia discariae]|uniref:MFS transporter n=1 Tax=Parafrankia discariae TaxID=365528 RepID=UPI0003689DEF|nr:MFS transporter [Parafrankia discariae]
MMTTGGSQPSPRRLRLLTVVLALTCGMSAANLYYAQPVLDLLADDFAVSRGTASLAVTTGQLGYILGLVFLVPLGDLVENRRMAAWLLTGATAALVGAALAPSLGVFLGAVFVCGAASTVVQILLPLAAHLAPPDRRGETVGRVMSGLLLGILLGRSVSGFLAGALGWRAVYALSAGAMLAVGVVLTRTLPRHQPAVTIGYPALLRSMAGLLRDEPILRQRAVYQACMFATFTLFWTAIGYHLTSAHHLSQPEIGLFALIGASGAVAAPVAGRLGDRSRGHTATGIALVAACAAMALSGLAPDSLLALAAAAVVMDIAVQVTLVTGQTVIYATRPEARARMNTVFITSFFLGGAAGSALAGTLFTRWGWSGVAALAAAAPAGAALLWLWHTGRRPGREPRPHLREEPMARAAKSADLQHESVDRDSPGTEATPAPGAAQTSRLASP